MKNPRSLLIIPATLALVAFSAGPLAHADQGGASAAHSPAAVANASSNSGGNMHGMSASSAAPAGGNAGSSESTGASNETESQVAGNFHQEGKQLVQGLVNAHAKTHSQSQRTKSCQAAKNGLETKLKNLQENASKSESVINSIYSKALTYQKQKNLNPSNFSSLISAANAAQAKAVVSVSALSGLSVNLDCGSATVAQNVATFKVAAQQVRSDLLTYRKDVVAVLQALEGAKS